MDDIARLTVVEAGRLIAAKVLSPVELTRAYLDRIQKYDAAINSFITVTDDLALRQARAAEAEIMAGRCRGPMHGVPYGLKDIVETAGILTTAHSKVLRNNVPATDAFLVERLNEAGAILLGKLACLEFAHGSPTPDQAWLQARIPWNTDYGFTGGSSTGSAAAVAAGFIPCAVGTDTGGSVRNPASLCGISGIMPGYGRISRRGVIPYSFSLDHVGPLAWTAQDCAIMLQAMAGYDPGDPGSDASPVPDFTGGLCADLKGVRIGWVRHFYEKDIVAETETREAMDAAAAVLVDLGAELIEIELRPLADYHDSKLILSTAEFWAVHAKDFCERFHDYGSDLQAKTLQGAFISSADYIDAQRQRKHLVEEMDARIEPFDAMLTASNFGPAPRITRDPPDPTGFFTRLNITSIFNLTANPALSFCTGFSSTGLPLAGQLFCRRHEEARMIGIAHAFEQATAWSKLRPVLNDPTKGRR